jgi:iron-sulfur cluster assembly accessory protein
MITVTESAAQQVMRSIEESGAMGLPLRIAIHPKGPGGSFHYQMGFDDKVDQGDEQVQSQGVLLIIGKETAPMAKGMTLDFVDIDGTFEFIFINSNDPNYRPPAQSSKD